MKISFSSQAFLAILFAIIFQSCDSNSQKNNSSSNDSTTVEVDSLTHSTDSSGAVAKMSDKNIKFLWRENKYDSNLKAEVNSIVLNEDYIKTISEPEKAALALVATFVGNECEWDGAVKEDRSNLKCKILWALDLGYQCSSKHKDFLRQWFKGEPKILEELENCPTIPDGATVQSTFDEINLEVKGNQIIVVSKINAINLREATSLTWTETETYELKGEELQRISKVESDKVQSKLEVGEG